MGRKEQSHKPNRTNVTKNQRKSKTEKEINEYVDKLLRISTTIIPQPLNIPKALENQRQISSLTEKIKRLEINKVKVDKTDSVDNRVTAATIENFMKWIIEHGAKFKGCEIAEFEGFELGLRITNDTPLSTIVISVPRKLMLTVEDANLSDLKYLMNEDQILKHMPNVGLSLFLLYEKFKKESFWRPYIDILPKRYNTVLYFNIEELEELKGSPTLEMSLKQTKSIARQYAYFQKLFHTSNDPVSVLMRDKFTYEEYCWAVSTVMTRQNTVPAQDNEGMINALIPLWDLCNHTNGKVSTDYNAELQCIECLAFKDFKPGEQFFIFYGARSNAEFFVHNGFVYEENNHDAYFIRLGVSKSDPLQERRIELLKRLLIPLANDFVIKKGSEPIDGKLLAFLRIFNMNEDELQHWSESVRPSDLEYVECAFNTSLENKSWCFLQARLKLLLGAYKTTLEEDIDLLQKSEELSVNKLLAVRLRTTEKKILTYAIEYIDQYIRQ